MKAKAVWILVLGAALLALTLGPAAQSQEKGSLRVGFNTWVGYGPLYIAQEKKFFADEGLMVELERIEGTPERRGALIAKRLDILGSTLDDLVVGASQGVEATLIAACDESNGADGIVVKNDIADVKGLAGRQIAVQPGFVNHFFLLYVLDKNGMKPEDVKIEALDPDKAGAAFVAGQIDCAVTWEPWLSKTKERKDGKVLLTTKDYPGVVVDCLIARNDLIKDRPADLKKFVNAWNNAVAFLANNPDEGNEIIAKNMGLKKEEVADMLSGVKLFGVRENQGYVGTGKCAEVTAKAADLLLAAKVIETRPDTAKLISTEFVAGKKRDHPEHPMGPKKDQPEEKK